ncbi:MAG: hypothetical protein ACO3T7_12035 [Pseudomonadales bacterium]|jgi:hypothetical protein
MDIDQTREKFIPAVEEILDDCRLSDALVDKDRFQIMMATIWGNAVLDPARSGIEEADLPVLHDFFNEELSRVVGAGSTLTDVFEFLVSKAGRDAMTRVQVTQRHKEFIVYFARLILMRDIKLEG